MFHVLIPTGFEKNLQPEWRGMFFRTWAVLDTEEEARDVAKLVPGAKVERLDRQTAKV
jgi:hypothetical protein